MSESSVGVFFSMLSWMSRYIQVTILGFVHQLFFLSVKILKLGLVEISAIHVATKSNDVFAALESGEYRFGMHMFMIYTVLPYKNITKGYFYHT